VNWKLLTTAVSTYFFQQDGFANSLSSIAPKVVSNYIPLAIHGVFVISAAAIITEAARWGAPRIPKAFTKAVNGQHASAAPSTPSIAAQPSAEESEAGDQPRAETPAPSSQAPTPAVQTASQSTSSVTNSDSKGPTISALDRVAVQSAGRK
jgi:hypothetical protein